MKTAGLSLLCLIILSASKCKKEGDNCHRSVMIINNSEDTIIAGLRFRNTSGKCILNGPVVLPGGTFELEKNGCWEDILKGPAIQEVYLVDPSNYNTPQVFYDCDSVELKNNVLKHVVMTSENMESSDFTISYP